MPRKKKPIKRQKVDQKMSGAWGGNNDYLQMGTTDLTGVMVMF